MTIQNYLLIGISIVAVAVFLAAIALPSSARVVRSTIINAQPDSVYELVSSTQGFQRFNPYCDTDPNLMITPFGPAQGVGAGFRFAGKEGKGSQTISLLENNRRAVMKIDLGAMGQCRYEFDLKVADGGTKVTWAMAADFGFNPIFRIVGLFMDKLLGKTIERGLANLSKVTLQSA